MLTHDEFLDWTAQLNLSEEAIARINAIRNSPPSRRVGGGGISFVCRYSSDKMECVIQGESHTMELPRIREFEVSKKVLEFYDQPGVIKLTYFSKSGRRISHLHTPDFFILFDDIAGWEECKPEEKLIQLSEENPNRYYFDNGIWRCPPGEEYARNFGLNYWVYSSKSINWKFQRNVEFLKDYFEIRAVDTGEDKYQYALQLIKENPGTRLLDLIREKGIKADTIFALIAKNHIYVDLYKFVLTEPETVEIYLSEEIASAYQNIHNSPGIPLSPNVVRMKIGALIVWDSQCWEIVNVGSHQVSLLLRSTNPRQDIPPRSTNILQDIPRLIFEKLAVEGKLTSIGDTEQSDNINEILLQAHPKALEEANNRYYLLRLLKEGHSPEAIGISERTLRDWSKKYNDAESAWGNGYLGLIPKHTQKGNHNDKLSPESKALMTKFILDNYETIKAKNAKIVWGQLENECNAKGIICPSYKTFCEEIDKRPTFEQTRKRQGPRAAYKHEPKYLELELTTPRHGEIPHNINHLDWSEFDIELRHSHTGTLMGRPYGGFITDAYSRRILATYASYERPSYRSCMMIIRELVKRFGRLPNWMVVDKGKEFNSVYFETLLALNKVSKKERRSGKPRGGSIEERLFGTSKTEFIDNLQGNTKITKNVRQVTKSVNPKNHAVWTLPDFFERLQEWAYEVYDTTFHPALGMSPREAYQQNTDLWGEREHKFITYDRDFIYLTMPSTSKGKAKVQENDGVKINNLYYWNDMMRLPSVEGTTIPVKYDPFNMGIAYAYIQGRWRECISEMFSVFQGRSEYFIRAASEELRERYRLHNENFSITASRLAEFITSVENQEFLLEQHLRDIEQREVNESILLNLSSDYPYSQYNNPSIGTPQPETQAGPEYELSTEDEDNYLFNEDSDDIDDDNFMLEVF